jgi:hypothetical protein
MMTMPLNSEQIHILERAAVRTEALVKIALKRGENKMAKQMDEEFTVIRMAIMALE